MVSNSIIGHYHPEWLPVTMTWLHEQVKNLNTHCENVILAEKKTGNSEFHLPGLHTFSDIPKGKQFLQRTFKKIRLRPTLSFYEDVIKNEGIQLLHSHFGHIGVMGATLAKRMQIPHVVTFYGMDIQQIPQRDPFWLRRYKTMFESSEKVFCEGHYMAGSIERLGCPVGKIVVHPLGIDLKKAVFKPRTIGEGETLQILIASSFRQKKGIPMALKAIARLRHEFPMHVTLIGDASDDPASKAEKTLILDTISNHGLSDIVTLKGYQTHAQMLEISKSCHLYLAPSLHATDGDCEGGAPVSIIEMAACGLTIVSSTHCDIPGVVLHRKTGWLARENQLESLVSTLKTAIENSDRWLEMQFLGRKHIERHFDARIQAEVLASHYANILHIQHDPEN